MQTESIILLLFLIILFILLGVFFYFYYSDYTKHEDSILILKYFEIINGTKYR